MRKPFPRLLPTVLPGPDAVSGPNHNRTFGRTMLGSEVGFREGQVSEGETGAPASEMPMSVVPCQYSTLKRTELVQSSDSHPSRRMAKRIFPRMPGVSLLPAV